MSQEDDIDLSLKGELEVYTIHEIKQLQEITQKTMEHMKQLMANTATIANVPENHRLTLELSIKQAEEDLVVIAQELEERKAKVGDEAFAKELVTPNVNPRRLAENDDDFTDLE